MPDARAGLEVVRKAPHAWVYCVVHGLLSNTSGCNTKGACWFPDASWATSDRELAGRLVNQGWTLWRVPELGWDFRLDDDRELLGSMPRDLDAANLLGSEMRDGKGHLPVIDLDIEHLYWPSTTNGHGHLYLRPEKPVPWVKYERMLRAMHDAGVIGWAEYVRAVDRGGTFVRKPGKPKKVRDFERMPTARFAATFMRLWWRALWLEVKRERAFRRSSV